MPRCLRAEYSDTESEQVIKEHIRTFEQNDVGSLGQQEKNWRPARIQRFLKAGKRFQPLRLNITEFGVRPENSTVFPRVDLSRDSKKPLTKSVKLLPRSFSSM